MNAFDAPLTLPNTLDGWLEKAVDLAYQAVLAISQGDDAKVTKLVDQLRFVKANAAPTSSAQGATAVSAPKNDAAMENLRCGMQALALSESVIQGWIQQRVSAVALGEVSDAVEIWQRLIDQVLPASWNFDTDLFVVLGSPEPGLQAALSSRGQRRVLFVLGEAMHAPSERTGDVLFAASEVEIISAVGGLHRPYPDRFASLNLLEQGDADPRFVEQMKVIQKVLLGLWTNFSTQQHFGKRWLEQGVGNIPLLANHRNLHELDAVFKGRPAVLIAPGPSLEKNIHQIRALKGRALLIAPLQTLRRLYLAGIQPDFLVVLDPADQTTEPLNFFCGIPSTFLPPLIAAANTHPRVLEKFDTVYAYSSGGPLDHWVDAAFAEPLPRLTGPSVALIGLLLARHWQCNPIILTGQDLALQGGKQYAADGNLQQCNKRRLYSLPGYYGGTVSSPSDYYMFHHQFELLAKDMAKTHPHIELYNCTEGGAFIQGFEHKPLQEVAVMRLTHLGETDVPTSLTLHEPHADRDQLRMDMVKRYLENTLATINASTRQAAHCRRLTMGGKSGHQLIKKLDAEERKLRSLIKEIAGFSIMYQRDVDRALQASAKAASLRENLEASRVLYAVVTEGCAFLRPLLEQALTQCSTDSSDAHSGQTLSAACA